MSYQDINCTHDRLHFGSGDYYIFCDDCSATWVHKVFGGGADNDLGGSNQSTAQGRLSGQRRTKEHDNGFGVPKTDE